MAVMRFDLKIDLKNCSETAHVPQGPLASVNKHISLQVAAKRRGSILNSRSTALGLTLGIPEKFLSMLLRFFHGTG